MIRATVSGSFRKAMPLIQKAVGELEDLGVLVLSPADPRVVDAFGDFLFVASDRLRNIRLVQQRHLDAIKHSDFLWVVAPDGYLGVSAAMEIGFAVCHGIPVLTDTAPADLTLRAYVRVVPTVGQGVASFYDAHLTSEQSVLLDPHGAVETAHQRLEIVRRGLTTPPDPSDATPALEAASAVITALRSIS